MSISTMSSWCAELLSLCYLYVVYDPACSPLLVDMILHSFIYEGSTYVYSKNEKKYRKDMDTYFVLGWV
jgi:hypothetical protein